MKACRLLSGSSSFGQRGMAIERIRMIEMLELLYHAIPPQEMQNHIEYL